jgi:hypothetical protein
MPRDGALTFGDLIGQLEHLEIACPKCVRLGRYSVRQLALQDGLEGKLSDWIAAGALAVIRYAKIHGTRHRP